MRALAFLAALGLAVLGFASTPVFAAPASYVNSPMDTPQALVNSAITNVNAVLPSAQSLIACTGTTTATCNGTRIAASYTGLTTAAGVTSAAQAVTDSSVAAGSEVFCQVMNYGGTGNPIAVNVVVTASTITYQIQNTHASAALNATVVTHCYVFN